jgi:PAS domain-containing protein
MIGHLMDKPHFHSEAARGWTEDARALLGVALEGILQTTGASSGWIALKEFEGRLSFVVHQGEVPEAWIRLQSGELGCWGFTVHEDPVLLNDFPELPILGTPSLRNVLSCPLSHQTQLMGHVLLANKATGFTSHDAIALQAVSRVLARQIRFLSLVKKDESSLVRRALDHASEGFFVLDDSGVLLHANETWCRWSGYSINELRGSSPPYVFWITHRDVAQLRGVLEFLPPAGPGTREHRMPLSNPVAEFPQTNAAAVSSTPEAKHLTLNRYPFRDRRGGIFWCEVATVREFIEARPVTMVYLRAMEVDEMAQGQDARSEASADSVLGNQTLALVLPPDRGPEFWTPRWEKLTGLHASDLADATRDLTLDWLFPRERDRAHVADLLCQPITAGGQVPLHLVSPEGSRLALCTFLPLNPEMDAASPAGTSVMARVTWLFLATLVTGISPALTDSTVHSQPAPLGSGS